MAAVFPFYPLARFAGAPQPVRRPKQLACFSYGPGREYLPDDSSLKFYSPPPPYEFPIDLSAGFSSFERHDDSVDEHLVGLLRAIQRHEEVKGKRISTNVVTWRGMMTKIITAPYEKRDGFEMNATLFQGCIFIEDNQAYKMALRAAAAEKPDRRPRRGPPPEVMTFWGYKFETLCSLPAASGAATFETIPDRSQQVVNNREQYCSVVRTGIGATTLVMGGEVDGFWDPDPQRKGDPAAYIELKTSQEITSSRDRDYFDIKLLRIWAQSFLLGVTKIAVGFRTRSGMLANIEEFQTDQLPSIVSRRGRGTDPAIGGGASAPWDSRLCVNFAAHFLQWLHETAITAEDGADGGVWRIRRRPGAAEIEVFRVEEEGQGYGGVLTEEFVSWRTGLADAVRPTSGDDV